ncbi:MAG: DUF4124 domain-containing protein [Pseudomonadota bacterium]
MEKARNITVVSLVVIASLWVTPLAHAQTHKWIDEEGTVHFTQDPSTIPEKYWEKTQTRTTKEDLPLEQRIRLKKKEDAGRRGRLKREENEAEIRRLEEQSKKVSESVEKKRREAERKKEEAKRATSSGYIPFEKFKYVQKGMTEAEVLSRFGPPTRVERDEVKSGGTSTGVSFKAETVVVKKYYYIGDRSKGEHTRIIIFEKGKVVDYSSISP